MITINSSPPKRPFKSSRRKLSFIHSATVWIISSPKLWPNVSFARLNSSRSKTTIAWDLNAFPSRFVPVRSPWACPFSRECLNSCVAFLSMAALLSRPVSSSRWALWRKSHTSFTSSSTSLNLPMMTRLAMPHVTVNHLYPCSVMI